MKNRLFKPFYIDSKFDYNNSVNMEQDLLNKAVHLIISHVAIILLCVFAKGIINGRYKSEVFICSAYLTARLVCLVFPL